MKAFNEIVDFIKQQFPGQDFIPLHAPYFGGNEKKYLTDTIDSTFVSSIGQYVNLFEEMMTDYTGAKFCVAIVNGTNALHMSMLTVGVERDDEVLTQALTFIATANAISYIGAVPVFIDVDKETLGMAPKALGNFLNKNAEKRADGFTYNKETGRKIAACIPMHTFGFVLDIEGILAICEEWNIILIEDAAESIGSFSNGKHTGLFGKIAAISFNGNKVVTCGGGGALITDDESLAKRAKHLTTQAKVPHAWEFVHDEIGYNYRMPNLNAALACAQLEQLNAFLENKRELATKYQEFFVSKGISIVTEKEHTKANYWLNAILLKNREERDAFLTYTNQNGVMARPVWELMNRLPMFSNCQHDGLENSSWVADRLVNIPSSVRFSQNK
jgi:perosamine synthetase